MATIIEERTTPPNMSPRTEGEKEELLRIWAQPTGWGGTAVNNTTVGLFYIGAALVMRTQLAVPENHLVSQDLYNRTVPR